MPPMEAIGRLRGDLVIMCWTCKREVRWPKQVAVDRLGWGCTVPYARKRLWCSACGERGRGKVEFKS